MVSNRTFVSNRAKSMPLSNAEKQRRFQEKRRRLWDAFKDGTAEQIATLILAERGVETARQVARVIDKRVKAWRQGYRPEGILGHLSRERSRQ
jgi:hypothetical protein